MRLRRIFDSQETASIKEARKLLVEKANMTDEQADKWVRGDLRAAFPILRDKKAAKFILGTTRLFVEQQLNDADAQNKLTRVLKEINEAHYDEFDRNLNGKSLQDLYSPFEQTFKEADKATRETSSNKQFDKSDYTIHGPYDSFEQAKKAWGNRSQDWCVFHMKDMYDNYTSAGQRFYVAAHNGWESVPNKVGDNAPKDAYGNSLIAISVDLEGNLATSTPRWNHENGGGDNTYTVDELEDILQMPFYETFKPYTEEERRARGIVSFKEAAERLASGEDPHDIFSVVGHFHDGFARVILNGKRNFVDVKGNFLSSQWFDYAGDFYEGFATVKLNSKWNLLDIHNNLLSDQWFDGVGDFHEGFARVMLNVKYNFIDTEGNLLSDQWFDYAGDFYEGFATVVLNVRWHRINTEGRIVDSKRTSNLNCKKLLRLSDSQETASIKEARKLLVEKANMTDEQADKWVRGDLRAAFPILRDKKAAKFILGVARLFMEQQLNDADAQNKLTRVLKEINEAHYDEFDRNLNGKSLSELYSPLESKFKEADKATREASSGKSFGKSDYKIYGPYDSFEQAEEEWGNNSQDWCVFHDEDAFNNYTSAGQRFYVAAQNGWESVPREVGVNAPKDAYGNSLIAISVDLEGNLATSTPRWNHANGGGDNTYTVDELEDILQMPFYETFKPYTEEERRARGIVSFTEAAERLASGEDPHDIFSVVGNFFEGFACVKLNNRYNFIDTHNNLLFDQWFDSVGDFQEGFAAVKLNGKCNFIDTEGNFLSDRWFDYTYYYFDGGFALVELNSKWNFIDTDGNLLSDQWFDSASHFNEGFADVELNRKHNFIDTQGNLLSDQWFDYVYSFHDGFARVILNGRRHRINTEGRIVDSKRTSNLNCKKLLRLSDSQETASIKEARKLLVEKANMTDEQADKWVRGDLRAAFPILRDKKAAKFILGVARLFMEQQLNDADAQNKLTRVLKEINEAHYDEFDRNLNGKSLSELYSPLESKFKEADKATREASSGKSFGKSDYKIYGPYDSFEQAEEEWGNNSQDWCVFHDEDAFNNYTSAGQRFYVAAHNGWESVPREVGVDAPKDAYGNSLIAISVDIEGNLATSTPRWNHANGGGDNTYTVDELEDILQMPFYETFKPYTEEERRARGIVSFKEAAERLASGEDPHDIFSVVGNFFEGFARVKLNGKWNLLDIHNNLLSDQWFDNVGNFQEGFARVKLNNRYNFIDTHNNLLSDQWFDVAMSFREGFAAVKLNGKWNLLDIHNNLLSDQWFDNVGDFQEGFAAVKLNGKWNLLDIHNNLLFDQWFDSVGNFQEGFATVKLNGKWNLLDIHNNLLSDQWFDYAGDFYEGFAVVKLNGKWNFINTEGNLLSDRWFDGAGAFYKGFADVNLNGRWHRINTEGRIVDSKRTSNLNCKRIFSILDATKRQKETILNWAKKKGGNGELVIRWVERNFDKDADQLAAAKWLIEGYDVKSFEQALCICAQKKLDPLKQNPEELVSDNADLKQKDRPLNPDDVLTDRKEDAEGNVTYSARDEDREVIRKIINTHFGKDSSPWCLLQGNSDGELTSQSADYWEHYSAYPKRIAFRNGKLLAFSAGTDRSVREWWDRQDRSFPFVPFNGKTWVGKSGDTFEITKGEVFRSSADKSLRSHVVNSYSENIEHTDSDVLYDKSDNSIRINRTTHPIDHEDDKYLYIDDGHLSAKVSKELLTMEGECTKYRKDGTIYWKRNYKNGRQEGWSFTYNREGNLWCEAHYKNNQQDGPFIEYHSNGNVSRKYACKNGVRDGKYEEYYENGNPQCLCTYKNGEYEGKYVEYTDDGMVIEECNYHNGQLHGDRITRYFNGNVKMKCHYVDGKNEGEYAMFTREGLPEKLCHFKDGKLEGEFIEYVDGKPCTKYNNKDGYKDGLLTEYFPSGDVDYTCTYKEGLKEGPTTFYYPNGNVRKLINYHNDQMDGESVVYREDGSVKSIANFANGDREGRARRFYESGALYLDCTYKDGEMDGWCITYYEDGSIASKAMYNEGEEVSSKHFEQGERKP